MKCCFCLSAAAVVMAFLSGCTTPTGIRSEKPPASSYPALTRTFDTSARLAVYGKSVSQIRGLSESLKHAGYSFAPLAHSSYAGKVSAPDLIVDIISVESGLTLDYRWVTCRMTVRVRKPMRTAPGASPTADAGQVFRVDAAAAAKGGYVHDPLHGKLRCPEIENMVLRQACDNLMNVEAFRLALERK